MRDGDAAPCDGAIPRRGTDRVERGAGAVLMVLAAVGVLVSIVIGMDVTASSAERARFESATRAPATAVLLEASRYVPAERGAPSAALPTAATWVDRYGQEHRGTVRVAGSRPAGSQVPIWIDRDGTPVPAPSGPAGATVDGVVTVLLLVCLEGLAAWMLLAGVRRLTAAHNHERWAREWDRVEPVWSGRRSDRER